ncbi:MAG: hypothetical protein ACLVHE_04550 [Dialister invisus]
MWLPVLPVRWRFIRRKPAKRQPTGSADNTERRDKRVGSEIHITNENAGHVQTVREAIREQSGDKEPVIMGLDGGTAFPRPAGGHDRMVESPVLCLTGYHQTWVFTVAVSIHQTLSDSEEATSEMKENLQKKVAITLHCSTRHESATSKEVPSSMEEEIIYTAVLHK